jgi:hypothetical protein
VRRRHLVAAFRDLFISFRDLFTFRDLLVIFDLTNGININNLLLLSKNRVLEFRGENF